VTTLLVLGATGLVGAACVRQALAHPRVTRVTTFTRRPLPEPVRAGGGARLDARVGSFDRLDEAADAFAADAAICALGTTLRQAGSREAFRRVDHDHVVASARRAHERGTKHFLFVSALGASPRSRLFYNRVKGETETALRAVGFTAVTIVRPSLLLGPRREFRLGERLLQRVGWALPGRLRPVHADVVAAALVTLALAPAAGVHVVESRELAAHA